MSDRTLHVRLINGVSSKCFSILPRLDQFSNYALFRRSAVTSVTC